MKFFRVGSCFLLLKRIPLLPSLTDALHFPEKANADTLPPLLKIPLCLRIFSKGSEVTSCA